MTLSHFVHKAVDVWSGSDDSSVSDFSWTTANQTNAYYIKSSITSPFPLAEAAENAYFSFVVNQSLDTWCWRWEAELAWRVAHRKLASMGKKVLLWRGKPQAGAGAGVTVGCTPQAEAGAGVTVGCTPQAHMKPSASTPAGAPEVACGALLHMHLECLGKQRRHPPVPEGSWQQPPRERAAWRVSLPKKCASLAGFASDPGWCMGRQGTAETQMTWIFWADRESGFYQVPEIKWELRLKVFSPEKSNMYIWGHTDKKCENVLLVVHSPFCQCYPTNFAPLLTEQDHAILRALAT